jgi:alpha-ribazole phosphatase
MLRYLLIRHGQTDWNVSGRIQGQSDVPLNAVGEQQVTALAEGLAATTIDAVYASDLTRARSTAEAMVDPHGLDIRIEPRLREVHFGEWEGFTYSELLDRIPGFSEVWDAWNADRVHHAPPGGESLLQFSARVESALEDVRAAHKDGTVALVSHGGSIRMAFCVLLGLPLTSYWRMSVHNTSVSEIEMREHGPVVVRWNDTHHLNGWAESS